MTTMPHQRERIRAIGTASILAVAVYCAIMAGDHLARPEDLWGIPMSLLEVLPVLLVATWAPGLVLGVVVMGATVAAIMLFDDPIYRAAADILGVSPRGEFGRAALIASLAYLLYLRFHHYLALAPREWAAYEDRLLGGGIDWLFAGGDDDTSRRAGSMSSDDWTPRDRWEDDNTYADPTRDALMSDAGCITSLWTEDPTRTFGIGSAGGCGIGDDGG